MDWISRFIQVSDSPTITSGGNSSRRTTNTNSSRQTDQEKQPPPTALGRRRLQALTGSNAANTSSAGTRGRVARSSTASLVAQLNEQAPARNRRGSGSGLALMRSLSATSNTLASREAAAAAEEAEPEVLAGRSGVSTANNEPTNSNNNNNNNPSADLEARNDLKAAFGVFDLDGDGFITIDEVRAGLKLLGETWSPSELQNVFSRCSGGNQANLRQQHSQSSNRSGSDFAGQRISIDDFVQLLL